jgi:uncharacterized damage-inducible protein DinB
MYAMAMSDPLQILLAHDRWATGKILDACTSLTDAQFHQPFEMGPGSVHNTALHMLGAMRLWCDVLSGEPSTPTRLDQDGKKRTASALIALAGETYDYFTDLALKHPVEESISRERGGKIYTFTCGAVITHVTTHGMHHRAQLLNMLRHLGVNPLPKSSVVEWTIETGAN